MTGDYLVIILWTIGGNPLKLDDNIREHLTTPLGNFLDKIENYLSCRYWSYKTAEDLQHNAIMCCSAVHFSGCKLLHL